MPYLDRGLICARQKITFHKFTKSLTLLLKLPYNDCIAILSFIYPPKSIKWRAWRTTTPETRQQTHHMRRSHFRNLMCSCFFCIIISCSHTRFQKSYRSVFFIFLNFVCICFVVSTLKTKRQQTTLVQFSSY
jgi:hypothetical protein